MRTTSFFLLRPEDYDVLEKSEAAPMYASLVPWEADFADTPPTMAAVLQDRLADLWADILVADYRARHSTPDRTREQP
jgi:hypothetical protein